jgi:hypothetical protein
VRRSGHRIPVLPLALIRPQPLANRVVRYAVAPARGGEAQCVDLAQELCVGRTGYLSGAGSRLALASPASAALRRAVALTGSVRDKCLSAPLTPLVGTGLTPLSSTVRIQRSSTVRTRDSEVLEAIVVRDAVDVVEDHPQRTTTPHRTLATKLANGSLEFRLIQASLELHPREAGVFDENLVERKSSNESSTPRREIGVEVIGIDLPDLGVLA